MDCKSARLLLEFARPGGGEVEAADAEALQQHLAECPECAALAHDERRADEHLGRAMRGVPVPEGLRERVLKRLSVERDAWYRRWLVRWAAAAALLLTVGLLGYYFWFGRLPAVDGTVLHARANVGIFSAQDAERAFQRLGITTKAPPQFNYSLLQSYGVALIQGRQVPYLSFATHGRDSRILVAEVYILSGRQFDLGQTRENGAAFPSGTRWVKLLDDPENADYLYLAVYTENSLEPFKKTLKTG